MQITINFHGNIYADFHGCPNFPVEDFFPDEYDEEIEGVDADDFDPDCEEAPEVPDVPDAPNLIFCTVVRGGNAEQTAK